MPQVEQGRFGGRVRSIGEVAIRRPLDRTENDAYAPGQLQVKVLDPRPHRDRADLGAVLNFVDDESVLWDVICLRYRDDRGWRAVKCARFTAGGKVGHTHTAAALGFSLSPEHLALLSQTVMSPFPYEEPSEEERLMRRLADKMVKAVQRGR